MKHLLPGQREELCLQPVVSLSITVWLAEVKHLGGERQAVSAPTVCFLDSFCQVSMSALLPLLFLFV